LVGLFEIVKREQPPVYDQIASKIASCRSLGGLRRSWWCNGLDATILKRVDDLEDDIFCPAEIQEENATWTSSAYYRANRLLASRKETKKILDAMRKRWISKCLKTSKDYTMPLRQHRRRL